MRLFDNKKLDSNVDYGKLKFQALIETFILTWEREKCSESAPNARVIMWECRAVAYETSKSRLGKTGTKLMNELRYRMKVWFELRATNFRLFHYSEIRKLLLLVEMQCIIFLLIIMHKSPENASWNSEKLPKKNNKRSCSEDGKNHFSHSCFVLEDKRKLSSIHHRQRKFVDFLSLNLRLKNARGRAGKVCFYFYYQAFLLHISYSLDALRFTCLWKVLVKEDFKSNCRQQHDDGWGRWKSIMRILVCINNERRWRLVGNESFRQPPKCFSRCCVSLY